MVGIKHERITIDPQVIVGKPRIKGTRVPVALILEKLAAGLTYEDVLEDHPHLTRDDILLVRIPATRRAEKIARVRALCADRAVDLPGKLITRTLTTIRIRPLPIPPGDRAPEEG